MVLRSGASAQVLQHLENDPGRGRQHEVLRAWFARIIPTLVIGLDVNHGRRSCAKKAPVEVGITGLDTPHAVEFIRILNDSERPGGLADLTMVAGYPGGSQDLPCSQGGVEECTERLGVEIVNSGEELVETVDAALLESQQGRPRFQQAIPA